jgi:hypothetical protein
MTGINWTDKTRNIVHGCHAGSKGSVPRGKQFSRLQRDARP